MAVRPILKAPDPILRTVCAPVTDFDAALADLARDMFDTMYAAPGRGLAAPQVAVAKRLFVMDCTWKEGVRSPVVMVNPQILSQSEASQSYDEGCLSIPGTSVSIARPALVRMAWQDLSGQRQEAAFGGFAAVCIQHEFDHLNGILCTDYGAVP